MEQKTAAMTGKDGKQQRGLWENHRTGVWEANSQIIRRVTKHQELDVVERTATSETVEEPVLIVGV
jgi:hypothetical protein